MDEVMQSYRNGLMNVREKSRCILQKQEEAQKSLELQEEMQWLAYHDTLTGLYNRSGLEKRYQEEGIDRIDFNKARVILVILDVNDLKTANDKYGHDMGDKLICYVAKTLTQCMETEDVFRTGGDEFLAFFCDVSDEEVERRLEAFHMEVKKRNSDANLPFPVSVACGVARGHEGQSLKEVQRAADLQMYAQKRVIKQQRKNVPTVGTIQRTATVKCMPKDDLGECIGRAFVFLLLVTFVLMI